MKAIVFHGEGRWALEDRKVPELKAVNDVLLQVEACAICGTDVHILGVPPGYPAHPGTVLGHEFVARVTDIGSEVRHLKVGDRVVVDPSVACGQCAYCKMSMPNLCLNMESLGFVRDGGLAEYTTAPDRFCHLISEEIPAHVAAIIQPLACVVEGYNHANLKAGETVLVLGGGSIGLMFGLVMKAGGAARVIVSEISEKRHASLRNAGIDDVISPHRQDVLEFTRLRTNGLGADIVVEAVGTLFPDAVRAARRGGRVIAFGLNKEIEPPAPMFELIQHGITVYGSVRAPWSFPEAIRLVETGKVKLDEVVSHAMPLEQFGEAIDLLRRGEGLKIVLMVAEGQTNAAIHAGVQGHISDSMEAKANP